MYFRQLLATTGLIGLLGLGGGLIITNSFSNANPSKDQLNKNYFEENGYNQVVRLRDKTLMYEGKRLIVGYMDHRIIEYIWNKDNRRYELISLGFKGEDKKEIVPKYYFGPDYYRH